MSTASERIPLVGLSLADAYAVSDALRTLSLRLRNETCALAAEAAGKAATEIEAMRFERQRVLDLREAMIAATSATLNGL